MQTSDKFFFIITAAFNGVCMLGCVIFYWLSLKVLDVNKSIMDKIGKMIKDLEEGFKKIQEGK